MNNPEQPQNPPEKETASPHLPESFPLNPGMLSYLEFLEANGDYEMITAENLPILTLLSPEAVFLTRIKAMQNRLSRLQEENAASDPKIGFDFPGNNDHHDGNPLLNELTRLQIEAVQSSIQRETENFLAGNPDLRSLVEAKLNK